MVGEIGAVVDIRWPVVLVLSGGELGRCREGVWLEEGLVVCFREVGDEGGVCAVEG